MKKVKIAAVAVGLLVLVAIANYAFRMDPVQLAARGVGGDSHDRADTEEEAGEAVPERIGALGAEGAAVVIEVFYSADAIYHESLEEIMVRVVGAYQPHVRVEPRSLEDEEASARSRELPLRGQQGLVVNGKVIHEVPGAGSFGMVVLTGTPEDLKWNEHILRKIIEHELRSKGIEFTLPDPAGQAVAQEPDRASAHEHSEECSH